jgi:hypothetical protein
LRERHGHRRRERARDGHRRVLPAATFSSGSPLRWVYVAMALLMVAATPEAFISYFAQALQDLGPLSVGYLSRIIPGAQRVVEVGGACES